LFGLVFCHQTRIWNSNWAAKTMRSTSPDEQSIFSGHDVSGLRFTLVVQDNGEADLIADRQSHHLVFVDVNIPTEAEFCVFAIDETKTTICSILKSLDSSNESLLWAHI